MAISSSIVFNKQLFVSIFLLFLLPLASSSLFHFYICCFLCGIIKFHWFERAFIFIACVGVGYQASYLFFSYLVFFKQLCQFTRMTSLFSSCFENFIDLQEFVVCMSPYANIVATLVFTTFSFFVVQNFFLFLFL